MRNRTDIRSYYLDVLETYRSFFVEGDDKSCGKFSNSVQELIREAELRHEQLTSLYTALDEHGVGMIVSNASGDAWALILPDASEPGRFRYQDFRVNGWISHYSCNSLDEVVLEAFKSGYRHEAPKDTLDKLSATDDWKKGCEKLGVHDSHNRGQLTFTELLVQFEEIEARYAAKAA